jgi:opacity protein-like surface antigen
MIRARPFAIFFLAGLGASLAQPCTAAADEWNFEVTPYLFATALNGTVGVKGYQSDVDLPFNDIWDHLDSAFMGAFTAEKGPWTFMLDTLYAKLSASGAQTVTGPGGIVSVNGSLDLTQKMYVTEGAVGYRVFDDKTRVDVLGGLRYTKLKLDATVGLQFTPGIVFPDGSRSANGSEGWTDFIVGVRVQHPITDKVSLLGYLDAGAGGSDFTYQALAGVNWQFSPTFSAKAGYRYLSWDYDHDGVTWDVSLSGVYLGLGIRF